MMKSILIVEDNFYLRENTAELLALKGYNVITARNGKDGFELTKSTNPDLILCDVMMPEIDGFGMLKLIKSEKATQNIPFIFFSAGTFSNTNYIEDNDSVDGYLAKPFTSEELYEVVERSLERNMGHGVE